MTRLLLALALALVCDTVAAKRLLLYDGDEFVAYAEADTIERSSSSAKMWVLYDYKGKHTYLQWAYWSQRALSEFDCREKRVQTIQYVFYEGQMGGGEMVLNGTIPTGLWSPVRPESVVERIWKFACGK